MGDEQIELFSVSVEDIRLAKLRWYRQGNEVSENQWRDIEGILTVRGKNLDFMYLRSWAMRLDVADLLEQATENVLSDKGNPR